MSFSIVEKSGVNLEVSIITTSMNYGVFIEDCIKSVKAQRQWHNAKINHIIMDGGSTDNTIDVLLRYKDDIHYFINEGEGQTGALNHAMEIIGEQFPNTTHVGWINADDFYQEFWLDEMYQQLRKEPADVALACSDIIVRGDVSTRTSWGTQRYFDKAFFGRGGNTVSQPSVLIRLSTFKALKEKYGFYFNPDLDYCQDFELWYRFLDSGYRIRHIPKLLACLRFHSQQMSQTKYAEQCAERDIVAEWCCHDAGIPLPPWWGKH